MSSVEKKNYQVNLRIEEQEYNYLQILAKALYNTGKIRDNKVISLVRWIIVNFQNQIAEEQAKIIMQLRQEIQRKEYKEFLQKKYNNSQVD